MRSDDSKYPWEMILLTPETQGVLITRDIISTDLLRSKGIDYDDTKRLY